MTGLAFSGGAAFGAYQAGVWLELQSSGWMPDVVSGISIGGVNAFLAAHGVTAEEMVEVWAEWPAELLPGRERTSGPPWAAQTPMFVAWVERVVERFGRRPLVSRLRLVALEASSWRRVVFENEQVGREQILAACALPGVLPPVRIEGRRLIDSGVLRYEPIRECLEVGADDVIAVDLLEKHPFPPARWVRKSILATLDWMRGEHSEPTRDELEGVALLKIGHPQLLGTVRDSFRWNRESVDRLIEVGRQDARERLSRQAKTAAAMHSSQPEPVNAAPQ